MYLTWWNRLVANPYVGFDDASKVHIPEMLASKASKTLVLGFNLYK
jgi:hypothetical protein